MNSNELKEHIRQLNLNERAQREQQRQEALAKIQQLRQQWRSTANEPKIPA